MSWLVMDAFLEKTTSVVASLAYVSSYFCLCLLVVIAQHNNFLLTLVSAIRFLIYFCPNSEKHVTVTEKRLKWLKMIGYPFLIILDFFVLGTVLPQWSFFVFDALLVVSAFLYIPIVHSIRAVRYLPSIQANQPQRYIMWQLVSISVIKFVYIIYICLTDEQSERFVFYFRVIDAMAIPFLIQISYLGCNRRTMITVLQSFKCGNFWKVCCCPCIETNRIEPEVELAESTGLPLY
ncbi:hypothetical protein L3Y34_009880 [Caenorhabditis briggsae]|nr:hypothetical protein L3Y34_009880 [Caenorhabditis briggsae]